AVDDRADSADSDGEGTAVRDPGRRANGRGRYGVRSNRVGNVRQTEVCRTLELGNYGKRQYHAAVHRVQKPELRLDQEQEEDAGSPRVQKVLQKVQESYSSQRDEVVICHWSFSICHLSFRQTRK